MLRFIICLLGISGGYILFAILGYEAVELFSENSFDLYLESVTTAAFLIGPIGGIFGFLLALFLSRTRRKAAPTMET